MKVLYFTLLLAFFCVRFLYALATQALNAGCDFIQFIMSDHIDAFAKTRLELNCLSGYSRLDDLFKLSLWRPLRNSCIHAILGAAFVIVTNRRLTIQHFGGIALLILCRKIAAWNCRMDTTAKLRSERVFAASWLRWRCSVALRTPIAVALFCSAFYLAIFQPLAAPLFMMMPYFIARKLDVQTSKQTCKSLSIPKLSIF